MKITCRSKPHPFETVCGDLSVVIEQPHRTVLAVIDGLGHGRDARAAAEAARAAMLDEPDLGPRAMMERCHQATRSTRGAAVGIMELKTDGRGTFVGVGNVAVTARSTTPIQATSHGGVVGKAMYRVREQSFTCGEGDVLCIFSDGLRSGLSVHHVEPHQLEESADHLMRDYQRGTDDATLILVAMT